RTGRFRSLRAAAPRKSLTWTCMNSKASGISNNFGMRFYFLVLFIFPVFFLACKKEKEVKLVSGLYRASERMVGEVHLYTMSGEIMDREVVEAFLGRNEDPDFDD